MASREYRELSPEEISQITAKIAVMRATVRDLEGQLRGHVRRSRRNISENGIHVEVRQSRYILTNPGLAALAVRQDMFPDELLKRIDDDELTELVEDRLTELFVEMLLCYDPKSLNKIIKSLPGKDILERLAESDPDGGKINKRGQARLAVRYSDFDPQTSILLTLDDQPEPEFDGEIHPRRLTDRLRESAAFLDELPTAPEDEDEDEPWYDPGLRTRDIREGD